MRIIVALLLAVLASVRGGGVALACEVGNGHDGRASAQDAAMQVHGMPAPTEHGSHGDESCDSPERVGECALMAACAPAIATRSGPELPAVPDVTNVPAIVEAPTPVDRAPDTPPPRS